MMQIRILSAQDVRTALPMLRAIDAMRSAFGQLSSGDATVPLRSHVSTDKGVTLFMPAYLHRSQELAVKVVSVYDDNPESRLPRITGSVLVLDPDTGIPIALMEGSSLTAIRTGAGGGLAAELLSKQDSSLVALFGAGVQARTQLQAVMVVRRIERVNLMSRTQASVQKLAEEIAEWPDAPEVHLPETSREAVQDADIVVCATTAARPLFDGRDLKSGTHVTAVGSYKPDVREVDAITVQRARVVVDSREAALEEAGDILIAGASIDAELGEIVNGTRPGRQSPEEFTFFKSVGVAVQDAAAAAAVLTVAESQQLGTLVEL